MSIGRWILFVNIPMDKNFLKSLKIPVDCEFLIAQQENDMETTLDEVYYTNSNEQLITHQLAILNSNKTIQVKWSSLSLYQRRDFYGSVLKAGKLFGIHPLPNASVVNEVVVDQYVPIQIWETIGKTLNFTTRYFKPTDGIYGHISPDNSLHGILKMVNSTEVDVSLEPFDLNTKLSDVIEFLPPIWKSE
ncbi:hypothetical protein C0J52_26754 [Blattella germanica]|nr:hypothetical protein C0J52_26754 [Blattella germanica]